MSKEVDQRIVQMQFDNAQFEKNTKQSLGTIEKLKKSLDFGSSVSSLNKFSKSLRSFDATGITKSLDGITKAAKRVDLTPISDGVGDVYLRFNALDAVAATVISNITNRAVNLGTALASALTVDGAISGLNEYETQINAIQTILSNTKSKGTTIDQVNEALDELNRYADKTIYNFTEMTRNIGTFTAAGIGLEDSVSAIKGIANLGAMSGSQPYQVANAMYQLSQALASGTVKLMDWNSVVTAGMGGEVFQDAIKETARVHGVAVDEIIAKEGTFRESLYKGWLTSGILLETLQKFSGDLSEEQLKAIGYTDEQIDSIVELGNDAVDAATKVKTFTQLIDTLKEANQSGWTQSWEYIFGDFEEARNFWTEMSDIFGEMINKSSDLRNEILRGGLTSGWSQFLGTDIVDSASVMESVLQRLGVESGKVTYAQIEAAGSFEESLKSGWVTSDLLQRSINEIIDQSDALLALSDEQMEKQGLSRDAIEETAKAYKALNEQIARGQVTLEDYVDLMGKDSGRDNLIQSVKNVIYAVQSISDPIRNAFSDVFPSITSDVVYDLTVRIKDFTQNLSISDETADKLRRTFAGVLSVVKIITDIGSTLFKGVVNTAKTFSPILSGVLSLTASIGDLLVSLENAISKSGIYSSVIDGLGGILEFVSSGILAVSNAFKNFASQTQIVIAPLQGLDGLVKSIGSGVYTVASYLHDILLPGLYELSQSALKALEQDTMLDIYNNLNAGLLAGILVSIKGLVDGMKGFIKSQGGFFGAITSFKSAMDSIGEAFSEWGKYNIKTGYIQNIAKSIAMLSGSLILLSLINPERIATSMASITLLFAELSVAFRFLSGFKLTGGISAALLSASLVPMATAILELSAALNLIALADIDGMMIGVSGIGIILTELTLVMAALSAIRPTKLVKGASTILVMATAVTILSSAVRKLGELDFDVWAQGLGGVGIMLLEIVAFMHLINGVGQKSKSFGLGGFNSVSTQFAGLAASMIAMTASIKILVGVVKELGSQDFDVLVKGIASVGVILAEMALFSAAITALSKSANKLKTGSLGKNLISASAAFSVFAVSIGLLVDPIKEIGSLELEEVGIALGTIGISLAEFVVGMNLLKSDDILKKGVALSSFFASMKLFAEGVSLFKDIELGDVGTAAAAMGAMVVALYMLTANKLVANNMIAVGTGLAILATGLGALIFLLNTSNLPGSMADVFAPFEKAGWESMLGFIVEALRLIPRTIIMFIEEIGNAAFELANSLAKIFAGVAYAIAEAAPAIGEAVAALIVTICYVIQETAPVIVETIAVLFETLWPYIESGLGWLWNNITQWVWDHTLGHDWFGLGAMTKDMGAVLSGNAEKAGAQVVAGYASAFDEDKTLGDKIATFMDKARYVWLRFWDIASPSKVAEGDAEYVTAGYAQGIQNGMPAVNAAMLSVASSSDRVFRDYWGIHSNTDRGIENGKYIDGGHAQGITENAYLVYDAANGLAEMVNQGLLDYNLNDKVYGIGLSINQSFMDGLTKKLDFAKANAGNPLINPDYVGDELYNKYIKNQGVGTKGNSTIGDIGNELGDWVSGLFNDVDEGITSGIPSTGSSGVTGTEKTLAEQISEKYEDQLDLNETLLSVLEKEHELWLTENENSASSDEILSKKLEYTANQISLQTERVGIAQDKYDEMLSSLGESDADTKKAYLDLLEEKNKLAELKSEQYVDLYENALDRIKTEQDIADKEYELWTDQNAGASDSEKTNKKVESITSQLSASAEELKLAEEQYKILLEAYGEADLRTMEAKKEWLDTQIEYQEKQNELWEAQLEEFDNAINAIERKADVFQKRSDMLSKIYDDGDLSTRSDDYLNAVEEYGKGSVEARRAQYQGSASAVLGVATALRNMSDQLSKTSVYQDKYNKLVASGTATAEELSSAEQELLSSQSSFIDYAGDLADAFDMDEQGKAITLRLAYAISDNWGTIYSSFEKVWSKVEDKFPNLTSKIEKALGGIMSEDAASISTGVVSTVTSALSGDYGGAIASGLITVIEFLGSGMGQSLVSAISNAFSTGLSGLGSKLVGLVGSSGLLSGLEGVAGGLASSLAGSGGLAAAFSSVTGALGGLIGLIPEILPIVLAGAAAIGVIAILTNCWDQIGEFFNNLWEKIKEVASNLAEGFVEGLRDAWSGVTSFVSGLFGGLVDLIAGIFGVHSPSTVLYEIGENVDEGFANGISACANNVSKSVEDMTSTALTTAQSIGSMIYDAVTNDGGFSYDVTPVVDLTNAEDSSNWLRSSFAGLDKTVSLNTERSARLAFEADGKRNQNGKIETDATRSQVVAAIDELSDRVVMMGESIENMQVSLDSNKLVGGIIGKIDSQLGKRATRAKRGG